jgi:glutamate--cysteine ligase
MLGLELEHFLVRADGLMSVPYKGGVEVLLAGLVPHGWEPVMQGQDLMGLKGRAGDITLEPGGQIEISLIPCSCITYLEREYRAFLDQARPVLRDHGWALCCTGYRPADGIDDIPLLPKERYRLMYRYFESYGGPYAHHMMKGTAAMQVSVDYSDENDFVRKMRVAHFLTPFIAAAFDNVAVFEGAPPPYTAMRSVIWSGCDPDRGRIPREIFTQDFGYEAYARMILSRPLILRARDGRIEYTERLNGAEVYKEGMDEEDIRHLLSMFFFDARAKQYIEVRPGDMIPPPLSFGYAAIIKGLMYQPDNLAMLGEMAERLDTRAHMQLLSDVQRVGTQALWQGRPVREWMAEWVRAAIKGLNEGEQEYIQRLLPDIRGGRTPAMRTAEHLEEGKQAFGWCLIE